MFGTAAVFGPSRLVSHCRARGWTCEYSFGDLLRDFCRSFERRPPSGRSNLSSRRPPLCCRLMSRLVSRGPDDAERLRHPGHTGSLVPWYVQGNCLLQRTHDVMPRSAPMPRAPTRYFRDRHKRVNQPTRFSVACAGSPQRIPSLLTVRAVLAACWRNMCIASSPKVERIAVALNTTR